jgi:hypothetical protein
MTARLWLRSVVVGDLSGNALGGDLQTADAEWQVIELFCSKAAIPLPVSLGRQLVLYRATLDRVHFRRSTPGLG